MSEENKTKDDAPNDNKIGAFQALAPYLNLGIQMAITIGACVALGWWLDQKYALSPILTLTFTFIGIFAAFYNFFRVVSNKK